MTLIELLEDLNIPYKTQGESKHVSDGWVGILCPFCGQGTSNYGLGINLRTGGVSCWKCGPHSLASILSYTTDKTPTECYDLLKKIPHTNHDYKTIEQGIYEPPTHVNDLQPIHKQYLRSRGFDPNEISKVWGVKGIGHFPTEYAWRLFIPATIEGVPVSWTTRSVSLKTTTQRYLNAPYWRQKYRLKDLLYGEDFVRHTAILVEGPLDCWAIGPGAVCSFGLAYTKAQVARLAQHPIRVILMDSEPKAQERGSQLANDLCALPGETYRVQLESGHDPASCSKEEIKQLRKRFLE